MGRLNINTMITSMRYQDEGKYDQSKRKVDVDDYKLTKKERKILGVKSRK